MNTETSGEQVAVQVRIEGAVTSQRRTYHLKERFADVSNAGMSLPVPEHHPDFERIGDLCRRFVRKLETDVPGLLVVYLGRYHFSVDKAPLFTWGEVQPAVLAALSNVLQRELDVDDFEEFEPDSGSAPFGVVIMYREGSESEDRDIFDDFEAGIDDLS